MILVASGEPSQNTCVSPVSVTVKLARAFRLVNLSYVVLLAGKTYCLSLMENLVESCRIAKYEISLRAVGAPFDPLRSVLTILEKMEMPTRLLEAGS